MTTPPEQLLWLFRNKEQTNLLSQNLKSVEDKVVSLDKRYEHLQKQVWDMAKINTAKNNGFEEELARGQKEAREMAELLASWKASFESVLQDQDMKEKELSKRSSKLDERVTKLEQRSEKAHDLTENQSVERSIQQALMNVIGIISSEGNVRRLIQANGNHSNDSYQARIHIRIEPQGSKSLEEYLEYGQRALPRLFDENVRYLEVEHVKAFVENLTKVEFQTLLSRIMEIKGWTWEIFQQEATKLAGPKSREKRKAT